jgi:hypothetical protein
VEQIQLFWPTLTDEEKAELGIKRWLRYKVNLGGEGPNHAGNITLTAVYLFPEKSLAPATVATDEPGQAGPVEIITWKLVKEGETKQHQFTPKLVLQVLGFGIQQDKAVAAAVVELFGEMPDLSA